MDPRQCSTPHKSEAMPTPIMTSTPTLNTDESPYKNRLKCFHSGDEEFFVLDEVSDPEDDSNSSDESIHQRTSVQSSFQSTCNELQLTNSVLHETLKLLEETNNKINEDQEDNSLIEEQRTILSQELSQLYHRKNMLEETVKVEAASYRGECTPQRALDSSLLNDTVLSNITTTLEAPTDDADGTVLESTLLAPSEQVDELENTLINNESVITINYSSILENTLTETIELNKRDRKTKVIKIVPNISDDEIDSTTKKTIIKPFIEEKSHPIKKTVPVSESNDIKGKRKYEEPISSYNKPDENADLQSANLTKKMKKDKIEFDNTKIIIGEIILQKIDKIKSQLILEKNRDLNIFNKKSIKNLDVLTGIEDKISKLCDDIMSLSRKQYSKTNPISKNTLSICETLINKLRDVNNSISESPNKNEMELDILTNMKHNAQYLYEVVHAVVHKTDLVKVRAPYISHDDKENKDNDDPKWDALRLLETDEERYKAVRRRWLNLAIPDPHSNNTYRSRRHNYHNNNNHTVKPSSKESRTESYQKFYDITSKKVQDKYDRLITEIDSRESSHMDRLFQLHNMQLQNLINNCPRSMYGVHFKRLYDKQMEETRSLKLRYSQEREELIATQRSKIDQLRSHKMEAYSFLKFYDGLNGQNALTMSKAELQEALEIDDMISNYDEFYGKASEENVYMKHGMIFKTCNNWSN